MGPLAHGWMRGLALLVLGALALAGCVSRGPWLLESEPGKWVLTGPGASGDE